MAATSRLTTLLLTLMSSLLRVVNVSFCVSPSRCNSSASVSEQKVLVDPLSSKANVSIYSSELLALTLTGSATLTMPGPLMLQLTLALFIALLDWVRINLMGGISCVSDCIPGQSMYVLICNLWSHAIHSEKPR